jgi:hypothetical protein
MPAKKTAKHYANTGQQEWHRRPKVLVRRTGDHVLAAVDTVGRFASNNFFLLFPSRQCGLDLYGLCTLLNSAFMTWYFRAIEPRQGRVFAELKIKHLRTFPLPMDVVNNRVCDELNALGRQQATLAEAFLTGDGSPYDREGLQRRRGALDAQVDRLIAGIFGVPREVAEELCATSP